MKPIDRSKQIMNSLDILTDISEYPEQRRLTSEAVEQAYVNFGFSLVTPAPPGKDVPTLKNVVKLLEEKQQEGEYAYPAELENAIYRLRQFSREGEDYFANKSTLDVGKLASSGLVDLDLSSLPDERFRALAAFFILQTLKEKMRSEGWSSTAGIKAIITLDEAWKVASDERSDAVTIIREGRKYQFGLIVASQNPTDINEAIFSNVGTTLMLRIRFERFMNYLQGSLNFSNFIRGEIGKMGVGQAAVDMSFNTSVKFPNVFLLEQIVGEVPLDTYTITIIEILTPQENQDPSIKKEFVFDKITLNAKLIENGLQASAILAIFKKIGEQSRIIDVRNLVQDMLKENVGKDTVISFLRSIGMQDTMITRIFTYVS